MVRIIKIFLVFYSLMGSLQICAEPNFPNPVDLTGTYLCTGNDLADDSEYTAEITVIKSGEVFRYEGAEQGIDYKVKYFEGIALFAKDSKDTFAAEFWQKDDPRKGGIIIYNITNNGNTWEGTWVWRNKPVINTEICRKQRTNL